MESSNLAQRIDVVTVIGFGMLLMPLLTMWHEVGGHAAACVAQGGHLRTVGAFYVDCNELSTGRSIVVACAGVFVNIVLASVTYIAWRWARTDYARLLLWFIWVSEAFVASGYFCFSGVTAFGDLGTGAGGSLQTLSMPIVVRCIELVLGIASYVLLVRHAIRTLNQMIGTGPLTRTARRTIAHVYYTTAGVGAVLVGLLNPEGMVITIMSAAASSFGGLAGFISIGYAGTPENAARPFLVARSWLTFCAGAIVLLTFALVLGRSLRF